MHKQQTPLTSGMRDVMRKKIKQPRENMKSSQEITIIEAAKMKVCVK